MANVPITFQYQGSRLCSGFTIDAVKLKRPVKSKVNKHSGKLTKNQIVEYLQNIDNIPFEQLINDILKVGKGELKLYNDELIKKVGIYKLKYTNKRTGVSKIFIEIHKAKGPKDFHHMHITDRYGNI